MRLSVLSTRAILFAASTLTCKVLGHVCTEHECRAGRTACECDGGHIVSTHFASTFAVPQVLIVIVEGRSRASLSSNLLRAEEAGDLQEGSVLCYWTLQQEGRIVAAVRGDSAAMIAEPLATQKNRDKNIHFHRMSYAHTDCKEKEFQTHGYHLRSSTPHAHSQDRLNYPSHHCAAILFLNCLSLCPACISNRLTA